jgi:iron-sulfur cluster repair protein YtfE (RIC family)
MAKAKRELPVQSSLYDRDFFAWTQQQANLLRHAAVHQSTSKLDFQNLAEEIESLGKRDRRALTHNVARIIEHLLKLQHARAEEPRAGWENSVEAHRSKVRRILGDSPGLKGELSAILSEGYEDGCRQAARSLSGDLGPNALPEACPYGIDQILDRDWWPGKD